MVSSSYCTEIVRNYAAAISDQIAVETNRDGCVILTPFLRPDGDFIEVAAESGADGFVQLTDMGETIAFLHLSGLSLSRRVLNDIRRVSHRYGVDLSINELVISAQTTSDINPLHALLQATLGVAALIEKRRPYVRGRFDEEVEAAIIVQGRPYDNDYSVSGAKDRHTVRFHVNGSLRILAQPFSQTNEQAARAVFERWFYRFHDILQRQSAWLCYVLLDDRGDRKLVWTPHVQVPLKDVAHVHIVPWSEKQQFLEVLVPHGRR
jgi:hypothetical protein